MSEFMDEADVPDFRTLNTSLTVVTALLDTIQRVAFRAIGRESAIDTG